MRTILSILIIFLFCNGCRKAEITDKDLAEKYCGTCHLFPEPSLLDKTTWSDKVLPEMKFRMGLDLKNLWTMSDDELEVIGKIIPNPMITEEEWKRIEKFYTATAPDSLSQNSRNSFDPLKQFSTDEMKVNIPPLVTLLHFEEAAGEIIIGTRTSTMYFYDTMFSPKDSIRLNSPPSDVFQVTPDSLHILEMGMMDPNDLSNGRLTALNRVSGKKTTLIDSLKRPVHFLHADFDLDGDVDVLISCFGNFTGALLLFENDQNRFTRHVIHQLPGNRKTIIRDFNQDGLPDIVTLITQGDEQITLFLNDGDLKFSRRVIYRFPPVYGSSYFDMIDMDNDGDEDIVYTNGDNADFSKILKPYHGIRILSNDGRYNFSETMFLPMPGAFHASARDFDGDGDIDIAAISYFPDFGRFAELGFAYFENQNNAFRGQSTHSISSGRWILMETGDFDGDNDWDIILGALNFNIGTPDSTYQRWLSKPVPIKLLENRLFNPH